MGRFPFASFPDGWFQVAWSDELAPGEVRPLRYFGRDLVLWRSASGEARVFDAFCPHLGAHLGHGGRVKGEELQCPFHAWRFDGAGKCAGIPYAERVPPRARVRAWPVLERNGMVMTFHHGEDAAPSWEPPVLDELTSDEWSEPQRRTWTIRTHNQEMAENAVDAAHFRYVHGTLTVPETVAEIDGPMLRVHSKMKLGTPAGEVDGSIESRSLGFGFAWVRFNGIVETLAITSVTPVEGEHVDVRFSFMVKKLGSRSATAGVGAALIADIEKQMREDTPIWENKVHLATPILCDGDGPIGLFRRWAAQFYTRPPD